MQCMYSVSAKPICTWQLLAKGLLGTDQESKAQPELPNTDPSWGGQVWYFGYVCLRSHPRSGINSVDCAPADSNFLASIFCPSFHKNYISSQENARSGQGQESKTRLENMEDRPVKMEATTRYTCLALQQKHQQELIINLSWYIPSFPPLSSVITHGITKIDLLQ